MRQVALTGTNITTTSLGFGCAELFRLPSARRRRKLLATAYDCGIRHFDLAPMYGFGAAEAEVGKFVCTRRSEVVIATKFGISASWAAHLLRGVQGPLREALARRPEFRERAREPHTAPATGPLGRLLYRAEPFDERTAKASLERSLRALGTDYVDIFLLHEPEVATVRTEEVRGYLESARSAGLIRAWGVCGEPDRIAPVVAAFGVPPVVQTRSIPATGYRRTPSSARITYGALTSHLRPLLAYLGQHPERRRHWHDLLDVDCGRTEVAASLLLCLARRANSEGVMLYGTSNTAHLVRTIGLFAHPPFTDEALDRFEDLLGVTMPRTTPISPEVR